MKRHFPYHRVIGWCVVLALLAICCFSVVRFQYRYHRGVLARQCGANLSYLGLALWHYHNDCGCFPPAYLCDESGKRTQSWRVLLAPNLPFEEFHRKYDFKEPWDSPKNTGLLDHWFSEDVNSMYVCPADQDAVALKRTSYVAVVGQNTLWRGEEPVSYFQKNHGKGAGEKILLIEIPNSQIQWTEPRDISFEEALALFSASDGLTDTRRHPHGLHYVRVNGELGLFSEDIHSVEQFAEMLQVNITDQDNKGKQSPDSGRQ